MHDMVTGPSATVAVHPLDGEDAVVVDAIWSMASATKGVAAGGRTFIQVL